MQTFIEFYIPRYVKSGDDGYARMDETIAAPQSTMAMESSQFTLGNQDPEYIQSFETLCQLRIV